MWLYDIVNDHIRVIKCLFIFSITCSLCLIMMDCNNKAGNLKKKIKKMNLITMKPL